MWANTTRGIAAILKPLNGSVLEDGCQLTKASWWFVPSSLKGTYREFQRKLTTFNARSEGIASSSTFRKAFATRRCFVPATGRYEWTEPPGCPAKRYKLLHT